MQRNVYGRPLSVCSTRPMTGYDRSGRCSYDPSDPGTHLVCATMDERFLQYIKRIGNDLVTKRGTFPGLKSGDKWCVCTSRWKQSFKAGAAPLVDLRATHVQALKSIDLDELERYRT